MKKLGKKFEKLAEEEVLESTKKYVGFSLPIELIRRVKIHVATHGGTRSFFVEEALEERLSNLGTGIQK